MPFPLKCGADYGEMIFQELAILRLFKSLNTNIDFDIIYKKYKKI